ncbi:hypothetical protein J564_2227 [Acinetobacter baumannii 1525283]|uniref:Uncharacterized protein n=1 Tax=Acinetobacter baumannii (strain 1295743) TaxID=1310613 RepID=A0A009I5B0_ACIB9|nr:hypothetical protein J512_1988 [Acinetobacter baumannii 1295743]EXE29749.1 hypothetical protein J564_2227 [Acinetobacter baumannii 1525283]KCY49158.1 hypothetical protein J715_2051 [Acinetobacter baumannii 1571545]
MSRIEQAEKIFGLQFIELSFLITYDIPNKLMPHISLGAFLTALGQI